MASKDACRWTIASKDAYWTMASKDAYLWTMALEEMAAPSPETKLKFALRR